MSVFGGLRELTVHLLGPRATSIPWRAYQGFLVWSEDFLRSDEPVLRAQDEDGLRVPLRERERAAEERRGLVQLGGCTRAIGLRLRATDESENGPIQEFELGGCWHFDTPGRRVLFGGIAKRGPEHQRLEQIEEARVVLLLDVLDVPEPARANPLVRGMPAQPSGRWRIDRRGTAEQADAVAFELAAMLSLPGSSSASIQRKGIRARYALTARSRATSPAVTSADAVCPMPHVETAPWRPARKRAIPT